MTECEFLYGVNLNEKITPIMIRDAIIECYYKADSEVLDKLFEVENFDSKKEEEESKYNHVKIVIRKFFDDVNGDFQNPTKQTLVDVIDRCREFALNFRSKKIIEKNYNYIMILIKKI